MGFTTGIYREYRPLGEVPYVRTTSACFVQGVQNDLQLMSSILEDYEKLPFPIGQSPFKVKGTAYRGHIAYAETNVPKGMNAVQLALNDPALREFFAQPFMAASFYDVYPLIVLSHVCARLKGLSFADYVRIRTRDQVETDLSGVYRLLLKIASPEMVALRLPQITAQYFNFGTSVVRKIEPFVVEAIRGKMPADLVSWYGLVAQTYVVRAMELNGAKNPTAQLISSVKDGKINGVELVSVTFRFKWG